MVPATDGWAGPMRRILTTPSTEKRSLLTMDFERPMLRTLHSRSSLKGTGIFFLDLLVFAGAILLCLATNSLWLKAGFSIVAGIMTSLLFVVGHDACHQSLTSQRWLNRLIGTLAFLPCLHSFGLWELG